MSRRERPADSRLGPQRMAVKEDVQQTCKVCLWVLGGELRPRIPLDAAIAGRRKAATQCCLQGSWWAAALQGVDPNFDVKPSGGSWPGGVEVLGMVEVAPGKNGTSCSILDLTFPPSGSITENPWMRFPQMFAGSGKWASHATPIFAGEPRFQGARGASTDGF